MCGSCQEFAPVWDTLTKKLKSIKTGKVNIDTKEGLALAQKLGVLEEGIPNLQLYYKKGSVTSLMSGIFSISSLSFPPLIVFNDNR